MMFRFPAAIEWNVEAAHVGHRRGAEDLGVEDWGVIGVEPSGELGGE